MVLARRLSRSRRSRNLTIGRATCEIADGIEARVRPERLEHAGVVVPQHAEMVLLRPAFFMVHHGELVEHGRPEFQHVVLGKIAAAADAAENGVDVGGRVILGVEGFDAVIREPAAHASGKNRGGCARLP